MRFLRLYILMVLQIALGGLMAAPGHAQEIVALKGERVHEDLRDEALISGNWLVGAHFIAPKTGDAPVLLSYVPGGDGWKGQMICVRATGIDGRYSALYQYHLPADWQGGLVNLTYDSKYPEFLKTNDENTTGIAIHLGNCGAVSDVFLPVLWNARAAPAGQADGRVELLLDINAGRADSVIAAAKLIGGGSGDASADVRCDPTGENGVGFNYQCQLWLPAGAPALVQLEVTRLRYGKKSPVRVARIQFHPPVAE